MANIKKAYLAIASLLAANLDSQVADIHDQAVELMSAKAGGGGAASSSFHKDEDGNIVALRCSYHQKWFRPEEVEFGKKASSASGYNTMCKDGMSKWTKQLSQFKKGKEALLEDVSNGEVEPSDIKDITAELEETRLAIIPIEDVEAFDTLEALLGLETAEEEVA